MEFKYGSEIYSDPLEEFRNNFFKKVRDERQKHENEIKRKQKNCLHKYSRFVSYNATLTIAICETCNHAKFTKN